MSRFAVNMSEVGKTYTHLLEALYGNSHSAVNLKEEMEQYKLVGKHVGQIVRVAISFDLFDRMQGKYAEHMMADDDDFID
jgi:hypothetical protein